jgi:hypothetical protein
VVCTCALWCAEQNKAVLYYSMWCACAALCQLSMYLFVLGIPKLFQVCTSMYLVCTCTQCQAPALGHGDSGGAAGYNALSALPPGRRRAGRFKITWELASHCQVPSLFNRIGAWAGYSSARRIQVHPTMPFSALQAGLPCSALCT